MRVMNQPIENAIGQSGITDLFVPARDWQLRGQDRGAHLVTIERNAARGLSRQWTETVNDDAAVAPSASVTVTVYVVVTTGLTIASTSARAIPYLKNPYTSPCARASRARANWCSYRA